MLSGLPLFVPQNVCLSCDGCCRFKEENSLWRPKITPEEFSSIPPPKWDLAGKIFSKGIVDSTHHIRAVHKPQGCHCTFFNMGNNTCSIYGSHPFDCQLYPFILHRRNKQVVIGVHLNCPFVQEKRRTKDFDDYVTKLKQYFKSEEILGFLKRNPFLADDYSSFQDEIEEMFTILSD